MLCCDNVVCSIYHFHNGRREDSALRCRCGIAFRFAPCHRLSKLHCASDSLSSFHIFHFPSYILPSITPSPFFPPSESAQFPRVFILPSEGVLSRHSFESALSPCFSCYCAFPTFGRCAVSPRFRPTFLRCAESSQLRERPVSVFLLPPCISHLPKVRSFHVFSSHLPKVRRIPPFSSHFPKVC